MKKSTAFIFYCALILVSGENASNPEKSDVNKKTTAPAIISTSKNPPTTTQLNPITDPITISTTNSPSTTNAPVPPTPAPVPPAPVPPSKPWNITDGNYTAVAQMAMQFFISYNGTNNQSLTQTLNLPSDNTTTVSKETFSVSEEVMKLSWRSNKQAQADNNVTLHFKSYNKTYSLDRIEVSIDPQDLPKAAFNTSLKLVHKQENLNITLGKSYHCARLQNLDLTQEGDSKVVGKIRLTDLQIQAFKTDKNAGFGDAEDCVYDTSDIVPIAVGCVLAGLVVIVLGVYLYSRRRSQARGYLSM